MKKSIFVIIYLFLIIFTCYLFTMQASNIRFFYMAQGMREFSLWKLTQDTWADGLWYGFLSLKHFIYYPFSVNIYLLTIIFVPFFVGFTKWWKNISIWFYIPPFLWLLFWDYLLMNQPIGGVYCIQGILKEFPAYYQMLPAWFQFLLKYFPAFGSWR